jgi:uncharacterized repeat protein (TIGR03803 family)
LLYFTTPLGGTFGYGTVARSSKNGSEFLVLKHFSQSGADATNPRADLILASDGFLYGTSESGGEPNRGTVFRISPDGADYTIVHVFGEIPQDGAFCDAAVIEAADGNLYGTTREGGAANGGVVFRLAKDGSEYQVIHHFGLGANDGSRPFATVIEGQDGLLYGVASDGGASHVGVVFRLNKFGTEYEIIRHFTAASADGGSPAGALLQSRDGTLFGVTYGGGVNNAGTVYRLSPDGANYQVIKVFTGEAQTPKEPWGALLEASDGRLYGTSTAGGNGGGTVFRLAKDGSDFRVLLSFPTAAGGGVVPLAGLIEDASGSLWGTCSQGGSSNAGTVFTVKMDGSGFAVVHNFSGAPSQGMDPSALLFRHSDGVVYGTTFSGGEGGRYGTVFRLSSSTAVSIQDFTLTGPTGPAEVLVKAVPGWTCYLEACETLSNSKWTQVTNQKADRAGMATLTDTGLSPQVPIKFYRVRATPSLAARAN